MTVVQLDGVVLTADSRLSNYDVSFCLTMKVLCSPPARGSACRLLSVKQRCDTPQDLTDKNGTFLYFTLRKRTEIWKQRFQVTFIMASFSLKYMKNKITEIFFLFLPQKVE